MPLPAISPASKPLSYPCQYAHAAARATANETSTAAHAPATKSAILPPIRAHVPPAPLRQQPRAVRHALGVAREPSGHGDGGGSDADEEDDPARHPASPLPKSRAALTPTDAAKRANLSSPSRLTQMLPCSNCSLYRLAYARHATARATGWSTVIPPRAEHSHTSGTQGVGPGANLACTQFSHLRIATVQSKEPVDVVDAPRHRVYEALHRGAHRLREPAPGPVLCHQR